MKSVPSSFASLGVEIGNSRIKLVAWTAAGLRARAFPVPLRGGPPRGQDIADGLVAALADFAVDAGIVPAEIPAAVTFSSQFAYPTFRDALVETARLLRRCLPSSRLAAADGLCDLAEAEEAALDPGGPLRFAAARTLGIRALAERFGPVDLAIDSGSTSTEIVPLGGPGLPEAANEARLTDGRLVWVGLIETPLDYVARTAAGYTVVPRSGRMAAVCGLLGLAGPFGMPMIGDRPALETEIAQSVGLDAEILDPDEIARLAWAFYDAAILRIAASIGRVARRELGFGGSGTAPAPRAGVLGLGKNALAVPALRHCGIETFVDLEGEAGVPPNFGTAAGLAFLAAPQAVRTVLRSPGKGPPRLAHDRPPSPDLLPSRPRSRAGGDPGR